MTKCAFCKKDIGILIEFGGAFLLNADGDFACSEKCTNEYKKEMNRVLKMSDKELKNWLLNA